MHFLSSKLKKFDFHRKTVDSVKDQTFSGAIISILSIVIILTLLYSSIGEYFSKEEVNHMVPDLTIGTEDVLIKFKLIFHNVLCEGYFFNNYIIFSPCIF